MISISKNSYSMVMALNSKLTFEFNNPMFDEDVIKGDYVIPFTIPYPGNARYFDFIHELLLEARKRSIDDLVVKYKGAPIAPAIMDVNEVNADAITSSLRLNFSSLPCVSKKLNEFIYGPTVDLTSDILAEANRIAALAYPATVFNFPTIYNPGFYGDKNADYAGYVNYYDSDQSKYFDNSSVNQTTLTPFVYLHHVIQKCFESDGYQVLLQGFMANTDFQKVVIYNNRALDKCISGTSSSGMRAAVDTSEDTANGATRLFIGYNDSTQGNYDALNAYDENNGLYAIPAVGNYNIKLKLYLNIRNSFNTSAQSDVIIRYKLDGVTIRTTTKTYFGVSNVTVTDVFNHLCGFPADVGKILIVQVSYSNNLEPTAYLRWTGQSYLAINDVFAATSTNVFEQYFELHDHLPDITFGELLNAIRIAWRLQFNYDHVYKRVTIVHFDDNIQEPAKDMSRHALKGHTLRFDESTIVKSFDFTFGDSDWDNENFKTYNPDRYLGEVSCQLDADTTFPPAALYRDWYLKIDSLHQIVTCKEVTPGVFQWVYYTDAFYTRVVNQRGTIEVKPAMSPLVMRMITDYPNNQYVMLPAINQLGSSKEFTLGENPYDLHLFFYAGIDGHNSSQSTMPTSSTTNIGLTGVKYLSSNLTWSDDGLYQFQRNYVKMTQDGATFIKKMEWNSPLFNSFNIAEPIRFDGGDFLIKSMKVSAGESFDTAEFNCYKY